MKMSVSGSRVRRAQLFAALFAVMALSMLPGITRCNVLCEDVDAEGNPITYSCVQCQVNAAERVQCKEDIWFLEEGAQCDQASQQPNVPDGEPCDFAGTDDGTCNGGVCTAIDFCTTDPIDCSASSECLTDGICDPSCQPGTGCDRCPGQDEAAGDGTLCNGGTGVCGEGSCLVFGPPCTGTAGSGLPDDPEFCTKAITVATLWNITPAILFLPYTLEVTPTSPIAAGQPFTANLAGLVEISEYYLSGFQAANGFAMTGMAIVDLQATVQPRGGGATGQNVVLDWGSAIPFECLMSDTGPGVQESCDPANDQPGVPGERGNTDCSLVLSQNPCVRIVELPTSADCAVGGLCDQLGRFNDCTNFGTCVAGPLLLPLDPVLGATYVAGDGVSLGQTESLFGWADNPPPTTAVGVPPVDADGTWNMLSYAGEGGLGGPLSATLIPMGEPSFSNNNRQRGVTIRLEGVMGVRVDFPTGGYDASPTPDSALLSFPVEAP